MNLDYKLIKSAVIRACKAQRDAVSFIVNYDKLSSYADSIGLTAVNVGTKSKLVDPTIIPFMGEYLKGQNLSWVNGNKHYTMLVFVQTEKVDEECMKLLADMHVCREDDPDVDKVATLSKLMANYPCYTALVVSYISNEPARCGKTSYQVKVRANNVTIRQDGYGYKHDDH